MEKVYKIVGFEEDYAITKIENRTVNIPFENIPEDSQIGDKIKYDEGVYIKAN